MRWNWKLFSRAWFYFNVENLPIQWKPFVFLPLIIDVKSATNWKSFWCCGLQIKKMSCNFPLHLIYFRHFCEHLVWTEFFTFLYNTNKLPYPVGFLTMHESIEQTLSHQTDIMSLWTWSVNWNHSAEHLLYIYESFTNCYTLIIKSVSKKSTLSTLQF